MVTTGHRLSHLVRGSHTWSQVVTLVTFIPVTPEHYSRHPCDAKTLYTEEFEFPALFAPHALAVSRHPCHAKTLFLPSPPRQNTFIAIPDTSKHYSRHSQDANKTLYTYKFEFPALFSALPWPTEPVPEINVNWCWRALP